MPIDMGMSQINQLAFGYWQSQVLFAGTETGVFDTLAGGPLSASDVAVRCEIDAEAALRLLDAGVAIRLLTRSPQGEYSNSATAQRLLTSASPESICRWVRVMSRWYRPWGEITGAVTKGGSIEDRGLRLGEDAEYTVDFVLGMHQYNARSAPALAASVEQAGARTLVDVGGGAGTYSIAFCEAWPDLRCEVIDLDAVVPVAAETVRSAGFIDRITVRTGNYYTDSFGTNVDVVFLSNVLHQESEEACLDILGRARAALAPGGRVVVNGHFLDDARTTPVFTTLHNLSALVLWDGGRSRTAREMTDLMVKAGLADVHELPAPEPSAKLLVGRTPGTGSGGDGR